MDTKWKNRKKAISFMVFFLGVSLTLGSAVEIWKNKPYGVKIYEPGKIFEKDYRNSAKFREYVANRLNNFLVMAAGGTDIADVLWMYDGDYGTVYETFKYADASADVVEETANEAAAAEAGMGSREYEEYLNNYFGYGTYNEATYVGSDAQKPLTEEQKKELADKYHDKIKGDKNLLYKIRVDGKELYANADLSEKDGGPEGYGFFLYFDGEKVRITMDGREIDVYGDGYYRDDSDWYVPGYRNYPTDENVKNVTVCIAVADGPVMYTESSYQTSGSKQLDNSLYWLYSNFYARRSFLMQDFLYGALGLFLLLLSFLFRKSKREAEKSLAVFQGKIWVEVKVLLLLIFLGAFWMPVVRYGNEYGFWQEWKELQEAGVEYAYVAEGMPMLAQEVMANVSPMYGILFFWGIYLFWNDFKYNKTIWKRGLAQKLYHTFSAANINQPLSCKMAKRSRGILLIGGIYSIFAAGMVILSGILGYRNGWILAFVLVILGSVCFLGAVYLFSRKNMETARDMETLSRCVSEIRDGNYRKTGGQFAGHDLEGVMNELEDIRHGMAEAVEEQMKSQRMKVELIANVSHDIKTPLTSIISYVQFLKQEEGLPEHIKDYIKILDEKSQRLKNMVMDVFAVSKAASGELPMHMEELDFGKLLRQTMADMQEEIDRSSVAFRTAVPESPVMITADGQRMYRVFQNLFQNAIKYSLEGSRVYVALYEEGTRVTASVKNTSSLELEKNKDFTERFVRGDKSRTDGGSGLGLSIAQSFTEACGGEFSWEVDADLFVVKVSFQKK